MSREDVLTHLRIMHTWATFALEKKQNFFNDSHMKSIAEWTMETIAVLKEQEPKQVKALSAQSKMVLWIAERTLSAKDFKEFVDEFAKRPEDNHDELLDFLREEGR